MKIPRFVWPLLSLVFALLAFAFDSTNSSNSSSTTFIPTASTGTSTNTKLDTIELISVLSSKWTGSVQLATSSTSGTRNQKVLIYETNFRNGTNWVLVDSTGSTSATVSSVKKTVEVDGQRQMFVVKSTGTQVSPYTLQLVYKKY